MLQFYKIQQIVQKNRQKHMLKDLQDITLNNYKPGKNLFVFYKY